MDIREFAFVYMSNNKELFSMQRETNSKESVFFLKSQIWKLLQISKRKFQGYR